MFLERLLALLTGAIVAICLGLGLVMMALGKKPAETPQASSAAPAPAAADMNAEARRKIEEAIGAAPEYAAFFARLRAAFPGDYDKTLDKFAQASLQAGSASADHYLAEAVKALRQARGVLAAKAEPAPLSRVFDTQLEVLRAVAQQDKRLCVAFLYGGVDAEFQKFAANRRALVAEMAIAGVEAIASGQARKIEREAPGEADFNALEAALFARGLGKIEIDALLDGKMPIPPLDDARMCAAGQTYLEVLRGLPEPIRLRIYGLAVELMARS